MQYGSKSHHKILFWVGTLPLKAPKAVERLTSHRRSEGNNIISNLNAVWSVLNRKKVY